MMKACTIVPTAFSYVLQELRSKFHVFVKDYERHFTEGGDFHPGFAKPIESLKTFFLPPRERLVPEPEIRRMAFVGVPACDLRALRILDKALKEGEYPDANYVGARDNVFIVSSDCFNPDESCFCILTGGNPWPEDGFDINISPLNDRWVLWAGSEAGEEILSEMLSRRLAVEVDEKDLKLVQKRRKEAVRKLKKFNKKFFESDFSELVKKKFSEEKVWKQASSNCVECGGCNYICPTCYCVMTEDIGTLRKWVKLRNWDSCQLTGYARVAGGANPRPHLWQRFRHRYACKYIYMPDNFGLLGCVGCGRCIEVCAGSIDMREVITGEAKKPVSSAGR